MLSYHALPQSGRTRESWLPPLIFISLVALILLISTTNAYSAQITIAWNPNSESDLAGYKMYYGSSSRNYDSSVDVGSQTSYTLSGLVESETYYIALTAYDISGNESNYSAELVYNVPYTTLPSMPTGLQATAISKSQIDLSWNASTDNIGITGYRIYRGGTQIATTANTIYQDTGLSPSTTYSYAVSAYDAAGNESGQSNSASETTPEGSNQITARVSQSSDDAEETTNTGVVYMTSSDLEFTRDDDGNRGQQLIGMRFQNVQIPRGNTITNAYIEYETDETSSETTNLMFYGEASDNPATFTEAVNNISSRPKTSSSVSWNNVSAWNTVNEKHRTPNLSSIIQDIVNRPGWSSGNSIVILVEGSGKRTAESYNGESANAPLLVVDYTTKTNQDIEPPLPPQGFTLTVQ
jgi:hypothetical protein